MAELHPSLRGYQLKACGSPSVETLGYFRIVPTGRTAPCLRTCDAESEGSQRCGVSRVAAGALAFRWQDYKRAETVGAAEVPMFLIMLDPATMRKSVEKVTVPEDVAAVE